MRTSTLKPAEASWYVIDAKGKNLGRLAVRIAHVLRGKHRPSFSGHQVLSDHIIVLNVGGIALDPKKVEQKVYHRHSGTLGNMKTIPMKRLFAADPSAVLTRAVKGMLPRNRLRPRMLRFLHIFENADHPHEAQQPRSLDELFPLRRGSR